MNFTNTIFDVSNGDNQTENLLFLITFVLSILTPTGYVGWKCFKNSSCHTESKCKGAKLDIQVDKDGKIDFDLELGRKDTPIATPETNPAIAKAEEE